MPRTCIITGSFTNKGVPVVGGWIRFTPMRMWVVIENTAWACLAPAVWLDHEGGFEVEVTPTDTDTVPWKYLIDSPAGQFSVDVPWSETDHALKELISH